MSLIHTLFYHFLLVIIVSRLSVKGIILNTRPKQSAHAYQQIWTEQGSPLLLHSQALTHKVAQQLPDHKVVLGMRYGQPSIKTAAHALQDCSEIIVLPLFPQYSLAATESAIAQARLQLKKMQYPGKVTVINDFYSDTNFIQAVAEKIQLQHQPDYHLLLSYHGLPVKQINKASNCADYCDRLSACPAVTDSNRRCYRVQCFATSKAIQTQLQLQDDQVSTSFQSRLGKLPWIQRTPMNCCQH
jgi:protoporphyrin/coproporphyrin ferrochelatase